MNAKALFDKRINLKFYRKDGSFVQVKCYDKGPKPQIAIKGTMILSNMIPELQVRVTNLYLPGNLNDYDKIAIEAGYAGELKNSIQGTVQYAFTETPGPDAITAFIIYPTFKFNEWTNTVFSHNEYVNVNVSVILTDLAIACGLTPIIKQETFDQSPDKYILDSYQIKNQGAKDVFTDLCNKMGLHFRLEGNKIEVFGGLGSGRNFASLTFLQSPPRFEAAGYSVVAPWNPDIRPGDSITFRPEFFRSTFGGFIAGDQNIPLFVTSIEFEFSTVLPENTMKATLLIDIKK